MKEKNREHEHLVVIHFRVKTTYGDAIDMAQNMVKTINETLLLEKKLDEELEDYIGLTHATVTRVFK